MKKMEGLVELMYKAMKDYFHSDEGDLASQPGRKGNGSRVWNGNGQGFKPLSTNGNGAAPFAKSHYDGKSKTIDLMEYWRIIARRKWVAISACTLIVILVGILTFTATPIYRAQSTIIIEEPISNIMSIYEIFSPGPRYDFMNQYFTTQLKLLRSRSLAERVAKTLNLRSRPEIQSAQKQKRSLIQNAKYLISMRWLRPKKNGAGEEKTVPRLDVDPNARYASVVLSGLSIVPVKDTRLVQVAYTSPYSGLAADIVNTLSEEFVNYSVETRYEATQQASEFLSEQTAELRDDLASKERALLKYGEEKKLFFLNDKESTVISKFADINEAFTEAQIDRIKKESIYIELKALNVDSLPPFISNSLVQNMKAEYSRMKNEHEEKSKIFKPDYPEMVNRKARLESMKAELEVEIKKEVEVAEAEYKTALNKERSLKQLLNAQKKDVIETNSNAISYNSIRIEVDNKRKLLDSLVAKQNETLVSARLGGLKTSTIRIVDKAQIPVVPISPNKEGNLILGLILGLIFGLGLVFLIDYLDNTIKGSEDVKKLTGLPSLGIIPFIDPKGKKNGSYGYRKYYKSRGYCTGGKGNGDKKGNIPEIKEVELINYYYPKFSLSEDYRTIRTSIMLSGADAPPKVISITSALPQEGKTATVTNIAVSFAQLHKKVLLIDADMRKPRLHKIFNINKNSAGLSGYLVGRTRIEDAILRTPVDNLFFLPCGPLPPNPGELLGSRRMAELVIFLRDYFDFIFIDTPPVLSVTDSVIVSSISEGTIMVAQPEKTPKKDFVQAVEDIQKAKTYLLGAVFNEARVERKGYYHSRYYRRKYYHYEYAAEDQKEESAKTEENKTPVIP